MLKKFTLLACIIIAGMLQHLNAQVFFSESFDGTTFPPSGWTKIQPGSLNWSRYTTTSWPSGYAPHSGAGMMGLNSFSVSSGVCDMVSPSFSLTTATGIREVSLWLFRDNGYQSYNEGIRVYINTSATVTGATLIGTYYRPINMPPAVTSTGWYNYVSTIPSSFNGATNYIIIEGFSAYGNDVYVDDVMAYNYTPCSGPGGIAASNMTSTSVTLSWTAVAGSLGYEYVIDQTAGTPTATPTAISTTTFNKTGLTPNTTYYLHLRNRCQAGTAPGALSPWVDFPFTTNPPCFAPAGFKITNLQPNSATVNWNAYVSALNYDIIVDEIYGDPTSTTGMLNTTLTSVPQANLQEDTKYYVHLRSHCAGNETSSWSLDSFVTPLVCRAPQIVINSINTNEAVASWSKIPSADFYEYAITTSPVPPAIGTKYLYSGLHLPALDDGKEYYIHVRASCTSVGIKSMSDWSTQSFKTFPTGVKNVTGTNFTMSVYPNPVNELLNIKMSGLNGTAILELTDVSGKTIRTASTISDNVKIDMQGLPAGMYLLKYTDLSRHEMIKIVKQ